MSTIKRLRNPENGFTFTIKMEQNSFFEILPEPHYQNQNIDNFLLNGAGILATPSTRYKSTQSVKKKTVFPQKKSSIQKKRYRIFIHTGFIILLVALLLSLFNI